jgi:hypothetical protein
VVSRYAKTPLIVPSFPGHSDISRLVPQSTIATGSHLDRAEKIPKIAKATDTFDVLFRFQAFWNHLVESFRMSKSS